MTHILTGDSIQWLDSPTPTCALCDFNVGQSLSATAPFTQNLKESARMELLTLASWTKNLRLQ